MDGLLPAEAIALATKCLRKQVAYEKARRRWAREINHPIRGHETEPPPGVYDVADDTEG